MLKKVRIDCIILTISQILRFCFDLLEKILKVVAYVSGSALAKSNNQDLSQVDWDSTEVRSILQLLNTKIDSTTQLFPKDVIVSAEDIYDLNYRISEKIKLHKGYSMTTIVTIKYTNKKAMQFTTWDEFQSYSWEEVASIRYINIQWEFYITEEPYRIPQKHSVTVRISSGMKVEEMLQLIMTGKLEELESLEKDFVPIVCRIDFVNAMLVDDIINIVDKWNKGLKIPEVCHSFMYKVKAYKKYIANIIKYGLKLVSWIIVYLSVHNIFNIIKAETVQELAMVDMQKISQFILVIIFGYGAMNWIGTKLSVIIFNELSNYGKTFTFDITKGDKQKQQQLSVIGKKSIARFIFQLIGTLILGMAGSILATLVTNVILK